MKSFFKTTLLFGILFICGSASAQSGAKFMLSGVSGQHDYLESKNLNYTGWEMRLDARLGARAWYFAPSIAYQNTSLLGGDSLNPFAEVPRLHTLKIPLGIGLKIKTAPNSRVFVKGGAVGNYVLSIDENEFYNFEQINDVWGSAFLSLGYDLGKLSIDYRYEQAIMDNFSTIENSRSKFHVIGLGINF